jgi:Ca-activated chloride channel family protein
MRGKRGTGLKLVILCAALGSVGSALAEHAPKPAEPALPAAIIVLDASSSMNNKVRKAVKNTTARAELGQIVKSFQDKLALGLLVFGHRKASRCADTEILAKPGELTAESQDKLLSGLKAQGEAPIAASLIEAANTAPGGTGRLDMELGAAGGDSCAVALCCPAAVL